MNVSGNTGLNFLVYDSETAHKLNAIESCRFSRYSLLFNLQRYQTIYLLVNK